MSKLPRSALAIVAIVVFLILPIKSANAQTNPPTPATQNKTPKRSEPPPMKADDASQKQTPASEEVGPDDVIRVKTTLVNSPVLVIGRDGKYVPTLRRDDFEIFEEGVKQEIAYFAPVDTPITVALLIDTSRSTVFELQEIQDAAVSFVEKMRPKDQAVIVSFSDEIKVLAESTGDRDALQRAILSLRPGGGSRVYDAVTFALTEQLDRLTGRKALIVFTDGVDNDSRAATYETSLRQAARTEALIYPVQFSTYAQMQQNSSAKRRTPPEGSGFNPTDYLRADVYLHQLAEQIGTGVYPVSDISDLGRAVAEIVDELHNEYSLGYYPRKKGSPGELRHLEVRVSQAQLAVRARTGYVLDQSGAVVQAPKSDQVKIPSELSGLGAVAIPRNRDEDRVALGSRWMCKGPNVPGDLAVVKEGFDSRCPAPQNETNAWFVRKPGPSETLCKGFLVWNGRELAAAPIPTGYVVSGEVTAPACAKSIESKSAANAWSIRLPRQQETICKGFVIPRGYVVTGEGVIAACPAKSAGKNAWVIRLKS